MDMSDTLDITRVPVSRIVEVARVAYETPGTDFLAVGESDRPSPLSARNALVAALDAGETTYPDARGLPVLVEALAAYLSGVHARPVPPSRVQVTASGMAAVSVSLAATVRAGDRVVVHSPGWPNVPNAIRLRGAEVDAISLEPLPDGRFRLDLDELARRLPGARAFVLNSPNNPTGWTATAEELRAILELCRRHRVWLISDEVYTRLVYDGGKAAPSLLDLAEPDDRVLVCNSFSKTWAMTGWRLGWIVVPEGLRDAFADIVEVTHSGTCRFAQHGAVAAIADTEFVAGFRAHCARGRAMVSEALAGLNGVRFAAPDAAFYGFIGIDGLTDSLGFAKRLVREQKVAVAPGSAFGPGGEGHLRLCFALEPARLERAVQRLRDGLRAGLS
jgi:aspartate aminotransferase